MTTTAEVHVTESGCAHDQPDESEHGDAVAEVKQVIEARSGHGLLTLLTTCSRKIDRGEEHGHGGCIPVELAHAGDRNAPGQTRPAPDR